MKIRKATSKDIEKINEIGLEGLFQEHALQNPKNKKKIKKGVNEDFEFHKRTIRKNLQDNKQCWIVVEEKGTIIGFGSTYIKKDRGIIESVYVAKEFQRKGYGMKIIKHLVSWLKSKKVKHIESNLLVKNTPSIKLHEKIGFKPYFLRVRLER